MKLKITLSCLLICAFWLGLLTPFVRAQSVPQIEKDAPKGLTFRRDNRAEAFTQFLGSGIWNYEYVARTTTPGNFVAPPAKAEEMYSPETFGRTATEFVTVK